MEQLIKLRKKVDKLDRQLLTLLAKRLEVVYDIFKFKQKKKKILTDIKREGNILEKLKNNTSSEELKKLIEAIYPHIFQIGKESWSFKNSGTLEFKNIGVIGLGLIGGSIVKALKFKNKNVKIYTVKRKNDQNIKLANKLGFLDGICSSFEELLEKVELIIIATPIEVIIEIGRAINKANNFNKKVLVIDVGSTKEKIVKEFEKLTNDIEFMGTHPMAGGDKIGFKNSHPFLFINYPWIITPHQKNKKSSILKIKNFIKYLGSKPEILKASYHDKFIAIISHLVFIISTYLFAFPFEKYKKSLKFGGRGFKDTTQLASANPQMHHQIFINNYKNINQALNEFLNFIKENKITKLTSEEFFKKYKLARDNYYFKLF